MAETPYDEEFQKRIDELTAEIAALPDGLHKQNLEQQLQQAQDNAGVRDKKLKQTVASLQESLDYLRLSIKYLVFDLEATRRENAYLRKLLEETSGGGTS